MGRSGFDAPASSHSGEKTSADSIDSESDSTNKNGKVSAGEGEKEEEEELFPSL